MRKVTQTGKKSAAEAELQALRKRAAGCTDCPLYATQTVFGEGSSRARIMLVGEQPGDKEDLEGHPFVGPAGRILDRALDEYHPSFLLRTIDRPEGEKIYRQFVADLRIAGRYLQDKSDTRFSAAGTD